jgi:TonB-linked SusC/RagA family outer membrane protein
MKKLCVFLACFVFVGINLLQAQTVQITGTVTSAEDGMPIPGASVSVKGTIIGGSTDLDGKYSLSVPQTATTLVFSFVGMLTQEIVIAGRTVIDATLVSDAQELDEVVITGYSTSTRRAFTGSATTVTAEQISARNVSSVANALAGEVPGVRVVNTSGQPGTVAAVRVRGIGTIQGSASPLYVVDGVPFEGVINQINPADIESTTILKDAAATAIFGSRGANGVIVITTKSGRSDRSEIRVEQRYGQNMNFLPRYNRIQNPDEYIALAWEGLYNRAVANGNANPIGWANAQIFSTTNGIGQKYNMWNATDGSELIDPNTRKVLPSVTRRYTPEVWEDHAFQASSRSETNVSFSGGSKSSTYYSSLGYLNDVGYSLNSGYQRLNARLNLTHKPKDWLEGKMNIGLSNSNIQNAGQSEDSGSIFWFVDNIPSIYPLYSRDLAGEKIPDPFFPGRYMFDYGEGRRFGALTNSIGDATVGQRDASRQDISFNSNLIARVFNGLSYETTFSSSYRNRNAYIQNSPFYGPASVAGGSISRTNDEILSYNFLQLLRYRNTFEKHNIEAFVAHENNYYEFWRMYAYKTKLANPNGTELDNAIVSTPASSYKENYALESYFGQFNYDFNRKYYLSATIRRDGSSRFVNNKWGTFGSIGAAWMLSEEEFMKSISLINMLKLKTSYGILGEQGGVGFYPGYDLYFIDNQNDELALRLERPGNPNLTWESAKMFQVGLEFSLGKFLDASVDYYVKNTSDLLYDRRVAPSVGYAILKVNDGELQNRGLEFDVTAHLVRTQKAYLGLRINGEVLSNTLTKMPIEPSTGAPKLIEPSGYYGRTQGRSLYDYYLREWAGVDPSNGRAMWVGYYVLNSEGNKEYINSLYEFKALNPDRVDDIIRENVYNYQDAAYVFNGKSALPKIQGGISLNGKYGSFDLGIRLIYSLGGYGYDFTYAQLMRNDLPGGNNWHKDIHNAWKQEGDITDVPRISADFDKNYNSASTRFLISSSYLSINNVRLGYTLPTQYAQTIGMKGVNVSLSGDNLWIFSARKGYDPTSSITGGSNWYTYNALTTFSVSATFNF